MAAVEAVPTRKCVAGSAREKLGVMFAIVFGQTECSPVCLKIQKFKLREQWQKGEFREL